MKLRPGHAALVSLFVPGLAHVLMQRHVRGTIALVSAVGLFVLGYANLGDRLWYFEVFPADGFLRSVPLLLLPEFANVGCTLAVASMREAATPDNLRHILLPRDGEHFWLMLTGFSGILSAIWAADAWWLATGRRDGKVSPGLAALCAWLLPGSGHVLAGQKSKGLLCGGAVLLMFALGLAFGELHAVDRVHHSFWWAGQAFCGVGVVFTSMVTAPMKIGPELPPLYDLGYILCTVAGLMNVILISDAFSVAEATSPEPDDEASQDSAQPQGASA